MNVSSILTMIYQNFIPLAGQKNKPNSNPNKPNLRKAKMNVNLTLTKDYRKKDDFTVRINKPNFFKGSKMNVNLYVIEDYENEPPSGPKKQTQNKPNFFKGQNRLPENLATPNSLGLPGNCCNLNEILILSEFK
ncbi:hypothetical protein ES703_24262 [subsurface metagenome]